MNKIIAFLLILMLIFSLCACGGKDREAQSAVSEADTSGNDHPDKQETVSGEGWEEVDEDTPFGEYRSEEELLKLLESETPSGNDPIDTSLSSETFSIDEETEYTPEANAVTFKEGGEPGGVELWDWENEMSEEELAAYEDIENFDVNDQEYQDMMEELEQFEDVETPDIDMEDIELPEGYEQYLPEGFDIESLLG